jgi:hypothetical protein
MKTEWIILGVAALLIFAATQTTDTSKQFKKTGADDVMFRTTNIQYNGGNIAFSTACDGSGLEQHDYYGAGTSSASCGTTKIIDGLPGTIVSGGYVVSCSSGIALYEVGFASISHRVCCYGTREGVPTPTYYYVSYERTVSGTQSAVSSNPANELMCPAGPVPCEVTFLEATNYLNQWVSCGADICN